MLFQMNLSSLRQTVMNCFPTSNIVTLMLLLPPSKAHLMLYAGELQQPHQDEDLAGFTP